MNKNITAIIAFLLAGGVASAQDDVYPAPDYKGLSFITNATIHVGNGQVINNGTIKINNGKIEQVGTNIPIPVDDVRVYNAAGKQVYPGMILPDTDLGLKEIGSGVRGSNDYRELGDWNTNIRSIVAYNTDSRIINTLKANGIVLASVSPQGGLLTGTSSVVQLDAWNWEDAGYQLDGALHLNFPSLLQRRGRFAAMQGQNDPVKEALARIESVKQFFREAKAYVAEKTHAETNLKFESLRPLFEKKQKLFVHAGIVKEILLAVDFAREFGVDVVIVGGSESWQVADLLRENNIAVILAPMHNLPTLEDDDVDQPYKTPAILQKAGVLFAINDDHGEARYRNLSFNAGTAAAYGLTKEEALQAVTLNPAKILGIADRTGTLEVGKDANIVISEGDLLDMRTSLVTDVFIQGRKVSLENKQTQLYERYKHKYGIK